MNRERKVPWWANVVDEKGRYEQIVDILKQGKIVVFTRNVPGYPVIHKKINQWKLAPKTTHDLVCCESTGECNEVYWLGNQYTISEEDP